MFHFAVFVSAYAAEEVTLLSVYLYVPQVQRAEVPASKVEWSEAFEGYTPPHHTSPHILAGPAYADPEIGYRHSLIVH